MEEILDIIAKYGFETVIIALVINLATGVVKLPIKAWASKLEDRTKVTRFIVFLPIILGLLITWIYARFIKGSFVFDTMFTTLWLTASSLSLTFYAIYEKMFPSRKKLLQSNEIKTSEALLEKIKVLIETVVTAKENKQEVVADIGTEETTEQETVIQEELSQEEKSEAEVIEDKSNIASDKLILKGKNDVQTEPERE